MNSASFQFQNVVLQTHLLHCAVDYPSTREDAVHHERQSLAVEHWQQGSTKTQVIQPIPPIIPKTTTVI